MAVINQFSNPVVIGPLALIFTIFMLYIGFKRSGYSLSSREDFEKESLESLIKPSFKDVLDKFGRKNRSVFRRDLKTVGEVYREARFNEANDYDGNNDKITTIDVGDLPGEPEDLVEAGIITETQKQKLDKNQMVPHRFVQTRPSNQLLKVFWLITDKLLGKETFTDYYLIPEMGLVENPGDESISIKRNIEFRPIAGIFIPLYESSLGILRSVTMRSLYEQSLEDQSNYHEKINYYDSQFAQAVQQIEAEADAEAKKYNRGASSDARGD